jgi:hypothetical protein
MDVKRPAVPVIGGTFGLIARKLRAEGDNITRQALPRRWVELLRQLNEEERRAKAGNEAPSSEVHIAGGCGDAGDRLRSSR